MTAIARIFLGWDRPILAAATDYLWQRYGAGKQWDLTGALVVVPAGRAQRRLVELLRQRARQRETQIKLPRVVTVGDLPEYLYRPAGTVAVELERVLAWTRSLSSAGDRELAALVPTLPARDATASWMELAGTLLRLHETLASDGITFAEVAAEVDTGDERRRWEVLDRLYAGYLVELAKAGRVDPHLERRRAVADGRCASPLDVLLVATADLSRPITDLLDEVSSRVTALIAAPASESGRFDRYGSVVAARWSHCQLPLDDAQLVSAGDAPSQAEAAVAQLAEFGQRLSVDEVTVGVTDESLVSLMETELELCGVPSHREAGWPLGQTAPGRLLTLIAGMLTRGNWSTLAALVRHAHVYDWMDQQIATGRRSTAVACGPPGSVNAAADELADPPWIIQLDQLLGSHFPIRLDDPLPAVAQQAYPAAEQLIQHVRRLLAPLSLPRQSLGQWCAAVAQVLRTIYGDDGDTVDDARTRTAVAAALRWLQRFQTLHESLDVELPAAAAMETLIGRLSEMRVVLPARSDAVEILGWLDLALDDAPAMVVVGMNHPFVPESVTADPFLPGTLRTRLKVADNERRYARDAYLLHLVLSTRSDTRLIVGRRAVDGSPTPPSRLLAAAPPADVARRVLRLLDQPPMVAPVVHRWSGAAEAAPLPIPPLPNLAAAADKPRRGAERATGAMSPVQTLSVTAFRDFLECPYRFYLRHVLKLRPIDDAARELAANQFGDLVHAAVERFGQSPQRDADDARQIYNSLAEHLQAYAADHFGRHPAAAVRLQIAQAERRLRVVADRQAARRQAGWRIWAVEAAVNEQQGAAIEVDGRRMGIRGRLDRIDRHESSGQWAILDYKTHGHRPEKKHLDPATGQWIDLQLPLYRRMIAFLGIDAAPQDVGLGYFNVSEKEDETGVHLAEFSESQFDQANRLIEDCIRRIWSGCFEISPQPVQFDDYAMICQTGIAQQLLDEAEAELQEVFE